MCVCVCVCVCVRVCVRARARASVLYALNLENVYTELGLCGLGALSIPSSSSSSSSRSSSCSILTRGWNIEMSQHRELAYSLF